MMLPRGMAPPGTNTCIGGNYSPWCVDGAGTVVVFIYSAVDTVDIRGAKGMESGMRWCSERVGTAVVLVLITVVTCGCSDSPTAPSRVPPFTISDLRIGTGTEAINGSFVTINYVGWLYDDQAEDGRGVEFERADGVSFRLGAGQVIAGWDYGVVGMRVGGTRRLVIPHNLAYGERAGGTIPPFATLVFDILLVDVQ